MTDRSLKTLIGFVNFLTCLIDIGLQCVRYFAFVDLLLIMFYLLKNDGYAPLIIVLYNLSFLQRIVLIFCEYVCETA